MSPSVDYDSDNDLDVSDVDREIEALAKSLDVDDEQKIEESTETSRDNAQNSAEQNPAEKEKNDEPVST